MPKNVNLTSSSFLPTLYYSTSILAASLKRHQTDSTVTFLIHQERVRRAMTWSSPFQSARPLSTSFSLQSIVCRALNTCLHSKTYPKQLVHSIYTAYRQSPIYLQVHLCLTLSLHMLLPNLSISMLSRLLAVSTNWPWLPHLIFYRFPYRPCRTKWLRESGQSTLKNCSSCTLGERMHSNSCCKPRLASMFRRRRVVLRHRES